MRAIFTLTCLLVSIACYSQKNYCADVLKTGSALTGDSLYRAHAVWFDKNSNVVIMKSMSNGISGSMALSFTMYASELSYKLKGLYIKFSDGSLYKDLDAKVNVEYNGGSRFQYNVLMILSKEDVHKLKDLKITMANFAYSGDVILTDDDSNKLREYIICMDSR